MDLKPADLSKIQVRRAAPAPTEPEGVLDIMLRGFKLNIQDGDPLGLKRMLGLTPTSTKIRTPGGGDRTLTSSGLVKKAKQVSRGGGLV